MPALSPLPAPVVRMLAELERRGREGRAIVLLRHSVRRPITRTELQSAWKTPLTPRGRALAEAFGRALPAGSRARVWWSPVPRCADTAACLVAGALAAGLPARLAGSQWTLAASYVHDPADLVQRFQTLGPRGFVQAWQAGRLPREVIDPLPIAAAALLRHLLRGSRAARPGTLDLHVTHDLNLVALLSLVRDVTRRTFRWPGYLEGVVLAPRGTGVGWWWNGRRLRPPA
ncbi:MAG: histidine phosphatase family protein [Deltaproteobacteria bacterium]|nr:histidine phosphatase family protein [Deltaproteobacteria bacterium]